MKKIWLLLLLMVSAALLAGCASNADTLTSPKPDATGLIDSILPDMTDNVGTSPTPGAGSMESMEPMATDDPTMPGAGIETVEDAKARSQAMEEAVEKLTEVDDAWVVAAGHTALVGVKFTGQYQGEVDERMKKMVLSRIQTVEKGVTGVAVTADETLVKGIEALSKTLESATNLTAVNTQLEELAKDITVYTE
ncbi:MAG: YhcN/YlaJ family sporulation lipoprotein [Clostridia bacterium]|nr:YhcN/YlaJ family sporulation lipoprotein [Clostridia bacterium]